MSSISNPSTLVKLDPNGFVESSIWAQNINPNAVSTNPYALTLLSHQTGLSITATAANTLYNIGTAISIPRNGLVGIAIEGHINGGEGVVALTHTRGSNSLLYGANTSSIFSYNASQPAAGINNITPLPLFAAFEVSAAGYFSNKYIMEILVLNADSLQFQAANNTAGDITYIDDLVVIQQ